MSAEVASDGKALDAVQVWLIDNTSGVSVRDDTTTHAREIGTIRSGIAYRVTGQTRGEFIDPRKIGQDPVLYRASGYWVLVEDAPDEVHGGPISGWISSIFVDHPVGPFIID
jgi:hypothetical protein